DANRMTKKAKWVLPALLMAALLCGGCVAGKAARTALAGVGAADDKAGLTASVQIRYLARGPGGGDCIAYLNSADARLEQLYEHLQKGAPARNLPARPYSPEARSDIQILVQGSSGAVLFYYESAANIVSYRAEGVDKAGNTLLEYECFTPGEGFYELMQSLEQQSSPQDAGDTAFCTMEELKAQLDKGRLDVADAQVVQMQPAAADFVPQGASCRIYDSVMDAAVPADKLALCALYADAQGQSAGYRVLGVYANDTYTIVQLDALLEDDEQQEPVENGLCSVMIDRDAIDLQRWIVFIDTDNIVKGVVVPGEWGLTD
ncbi:MAG: hypothetical protein PHO66_08520, partial [Eubacteriales bacterium]|nr:hypothetical protein [Eubacteriales bacterium]